MHTYTWPLLWLLYGDDDDTTWCMVNFLQNSFVFSEMKFVPSSEIIPLGNLYSANTILQYFIRWSADFSSINFTTRNMLWLSTAHT